MNNIVVHEIQNKATNYFHKFESYIDNSKLQSKWKNLLQTQGALKSYLGKPWKEFIYQFGAYVNSNQVYIFRGELDNFIKTTICRLISEFSDSTHCVLDKNVVECKSFGSEEVTSDIDVTINGTCISNNLITLEVIKKVLLYFFKDEFGDNLGQIFRFFDMNFYLSDFEFPKLNLSSPVVHEKQTDSTQCRNAFKKDKPCVLKDLNDFYISTSIQQLKLAFLVNGNHGIDKELEYQSAVLTLNNTIKDMKKIKDNEQYHNIMIDMISYIATFEDECYITQGAFFHVVLMTQRNYVFTDVLSNDDLMYKYSFMMLCSFIENIKMAYTHRHSPKSFNKYVTRALDAHERIIFESLYTFMTHGIAQIARLETINLNITLQTIEDVVHVLIDIYNGLEQTRANKNISIPNWFSTVKQNLQATLYAQWRNYETYLSDYLNDLANNYVSPNDNGSAFLNMGGAMFKKQRSKDNTPIKKIINGKERVVYVDAKRCQYVKMNGKFTPIKELRQLEKKKPTNKKAPRGKENKK